MGTVVSEGRRNAGLHHVSFCHVRVPLALVLVLWAFLWRSLVALVFETYPRDRYSIALGAQHHDFLWLVLEKEVRNFLCPHSGFVWQERFVVKRCLGEPSSMESPLDPGLRYVGVRL